MTSTLRALLLLFLTGLGLVLLPACPPSKPLGDDSAQDDDDDTAADDDDDTAADDDDDTAADDDDDTTGDDDDTSGEWDWVGTVASGGQIDAVRSPDGLIHLVSARYYQFDIGGNVLVDEDVGDGRQGTMDFPPAIAVGDDGTVHLVTRHDGDWGSGHDIRYRRRSAAGVWNRDYLFGSRVARNYVVSVAWGGVDEVFMSYTEAGDDVWGDVQVWQAGETSATHLGAVGGIWRADADTRMRGISERVFMGAGRPDPTGQAYFLNANAAADLPAELSVSKQIHSAGSGRTGFPDLYVDGTDTVHFSYGALETVFYNKYTAAGSRVFSSDIAVFDGLGSWHLSCGLSAIAASDDGDSVLAIGLLSDGSAGATNSDLLWAYSVDGGASWSDPQDTGRNTNAGEGRSRPRLVAVGEKFFLFYNDTANSGISLGTITLPGGP